MGRRIGADSTERALLSSIGDASLVEIEGLSERSEGDGGAWISPAERVDRRCRARRCGL